MFAGNGAAPFKHLLEEVIQWRLCALLRVRVRSVDHYVHMDVSVAGVTKAGDRHAMLFLETGRKTKQIFEPATRHHDVLVQFDQTGIAQRIRKFAANAPEFFTRWRTERLGNELRFELRHNPSNLLEFCRYSRFLAVELNDQMRVAASEHFAAGPFVCCRDRKRISQLNGARK